MGVEESSRSKGWGSCSGQLKSPAERKCERCSSAPRQDAGCTPQRIRASVKALTKDCQELLELFIPVKYKKKKLSETKG